MKKQVKPYATPSLPDPGNKVSALVSHGQAHIAAITNSPDYPSAPSVQQATSAWNAENAALASLDAEITDLLNKLKVARTTQQTTLRRWRSRKGAVLTAINNHCDGAKAKVEGFGVGVLGQTPHIPAQVPQGMRALRSKTPGTATVVWSAQKGIHSYMVQHATDPANPATYSTPIPCTRAKFAMIEQPLGATIHFRVLAVDAALPTGQTEYSSWVPATVSS